jgi:hypothetical protein
MEGTIRRVFLSFTHCHWYKTHAFVFCLLISLLDSSLFSTVMALDISQEVVGWAWTKFPPQDDDPDIETLESIPYFTSDHHSPKLSTYNHHKSIQDNILSTIGSVVRDENVRGFLVGWPLQPNARPGLECGRTLHLLDFLANQTNHPIIHKNRPVALWDKRILTHNRFEEHVSPEDVWKRSVLYTRTPATCSREKQLIQDGVYSSKSQIYPCTSSAAYCATSMLQQFTQTMDSRSTELESDSFLHRKRKRGELHDARNVVESFDSGGYSQSLLI